MKKWIAGILCLMLAVMPGYAEEDDEHDCGEYQDQWEYNYIAPTEDERGQIGPAYCPVCGEIVDEKITVILSLKEQRELEGQGEVTPPASTTEVPTVPVTTEDGSVTTKPGTTETEEPDDPVDEETPTGSLTETSPPPDTDPETSPPSDSDPVTSPPPDTDPETSSPSDSDPVTSPPPDTDPETSPPSDSDPVTSPPPDTDPEESDGSIESPPAETTPDDPDEDETPTPPPVTDPAPTPTPTPVPPVVVIDEDTEGLDPSAATAVITVTEQPVLVLEDVTATPAPTAAATTGKKTSSKKKPAVTATPEPAQEIRYWRHAKMNAEQIEPGFAGRQVWPEQVRSPLLDRMGR